MEDMGKNFFTWLFRSPAQDADAPKHESLVEHLEKHCRAKKQCPLVAKAANAAEREDEAKPRYSRLLPDDDHAVLCEENPEYKAVYERYHGTNGWHKAPNGKPSNLTERQWVMVRTPSFKKWFGEWEIVAIQRFLEGDPVARASGNEHITVNDNDVLRNIIYDGYRRVNWRSNNPQIGTVELTKSGIRDSIGKGIGRAKIAAFDYIPEIIEKGRVVNNESNWKGRGYDTSVITAPISIGGKQYAAFVVVRKHSNGSNNFYLHEVGLIEYIKKEAERLRTGSSDDAALSRPSGSVKSIALSIFSVNADSVSKIVDENGEPMVVYHGNLYGDTFTRFTTKHQWSDAPAGSFWFTDDIDVAKGYMRYATDKTPMALFLDIKYPFEYDANGKGFKHSGVNEIVENEIECGESDGAIIRNIIDTLNDPDAKKTATDIVAFKPSQIKSAEPIAYDDDVEMIPLTRRFNKGSDIRGKVTE